MSRNGDKKIGAQRRGGAGTGGHDGTRMLQKESTPAALRVLIADDSRDEVAMLSVILRDEGHTVREVYRGSEVLRVVSEFDPDVALLDIGMPGMTGYDVAREVRKLYGKARPVLVAITGWKQSADRTRAAIAGFDHHIAKPFETSELLALLGKAP